MESDLRVAGGCGEPLLLGLERLLRRLGLGLQLVVDSLLGIRRLGFQDLQLCLHQRLLQRLVD